MSQDGNDRSTNPPGSDNPFPEVAERVVGAGLVQTTDASDLYRFLEVGRDFTTWVKGRLTKYGFVENIDYVKVQDLSSPVSGSAKARSQKVLVYYLTLDTAKEIAMVENNEKGRAARRYFIECERRAKEGSLPADAMALLAQTNGIARQLSGRLAKMRAEIDVLAGQHPVPALDFAETVSAYQIIEMSGIAKEDRQRGTAQMVTNRMIAFCARRQVACLRTPAVVNPAEPYRFPHNLACGWLLGDERGIELIRNQVDRAKAKKARNGRATGQAALALVPPSQPGAQP